MKCTICGISAPGHELRELRCLDCIAKELASTKAIVAQLKEALEFVWNESEMGYIQDTTYQECVGCGFKNGTHEGQCCQGKIEAALEAARKSGL